MARPAASADVFRAIADPTRRRMLDRLAARPENVGELASDFHISLPAVSQHLKVLRQAGLVREERAGRQRLYRLEPGPLRAVADWVRHYEAFWAQRLDALGQFLESETCAETSSSSGATPTRRSGSGGRSPTRPRSRRG